MQQQVFVTDVAGNPAINQVALMDRAIDFVFSMKSLADVSEGDVPDEIGRVHETLLTAAVTMMRRQGVSPKVVFPTGAEAVPQIGRFASILTSAQPIDLTALSVVDAGTLDVVVDVPPQPSDDVSASELTADVQPQLSFDLRVVAEPSPETAPIRSPEHTSARKTKPTVAKSGGRHRRRSDVELPTHKLPRRLKRKEDALRWDTIICLEDGRPVQDLAKHLEGLGIKFEDYLAKWDLAPTYPRQAPGHVMKRGVMYEFDPIHRRLIKV